MLLIRLFFFLLLGFTVLFDVAMATSDTSDIQEAYDANQPPAKPNNQKNEKKEKKETNVKNEKDLKDGKRENVQMILPNANNIPGYASASCAETENGLLYIETLTSFTRPVPGTIPPCAFGYSFTRIRNHEIGYTAMAVASRCLGAGAQFWVRQYNPQETLLTDGYLLLYALLPPGAKANFQIPARTQMAAPTATVDADSKTDIIIGEEKRVDVLTETLYTPMPYMCLNTEWGISYLTEWN